MIGRLCFVAVLGCLPIAWLAAADGSARVELNQLSGPEQAEGWKLLFDGKTTNGWRGAKGTPFPSKSWMVEDGAFRTREDGSAGDLFTVDRYSDFELSVDWKISPKGNSGIKYLVQDEWLSPHFSPDLSDAEKRVQRLAAVGYEFQVMDDSILPRHPGWEKSSTGALYLLYAPHDKKVNPPGEWNNARILVRGNHVEHWLNGVKVVECELGSKEILDLVAATKFHKVPGYGIKGPGYIVLQHHGAPAWFRTIKIRDLSK